MKYLHRQIFSANFVGSNKNAKAYMDVEESMREILRAESRAILNIPVTEAYEAAVAAIVERVHHRGGKLVTAGMGKAGRLP